MNRSSTLSDPRRKATKAAPRPFDAVLAQAIQAHREDDLDTAERLYGQVLDMQMAQPDALHFLGVLSHQHMSELK